ncbi:MAG: hypothetical protein CL467_01975 [Acidimicrobiaceae bacterium]|nr:hypothetical protein [Acidimicrobiaceae bacterium]|tara:strand:- start:1991 stop:2386 length:396 start_codon:yes stop_codon:yes gene_type:complete
MADLSFLSEAWVAEFAAAGAKLPERSGVDGTIRFVVTSTPHGKVQLLLTVVDGRLSKVVATRDGKAEATVTWKYSDAVAQFRGDLDADEAFMSGRCKVEDSYLRYLFDLRPVFGSSEWSVMLSDLAGRSEF